ncbi:hypothetical protein [Streptomyces sp. RFCAC02]|uniref:hypothetical protein n=1 Tax=Streptomyces sp. RFCAC02 TaxID=2499143 RepID=UPI0010200345|nr:hypothetical protein [Streptomyces sp. RFCAC02]
MPEPVTDLTTYAEILAEELPGDWQATTHDLTGDRDSTLTDDVWDLDLMADALARRRVEHCAVLHGDVPRRLFLIEHGRGFLAAAMAPAGVQPEAFRGVREPDGIAISADDPALAAASITSDLLPRYDVALAKVRRAGEAMAVKTDTDRVMLTWTGRDLRVHARPAAVTEALIRSGFEPRDGTLVLPGADSARQAAAVRDAATRLAELGVGLAIRTAPPEPTAPARTASSPALRHR